MSNNRPPQWSTVTVTFIDGTTLVMNMDAGPGISRYLSDELSQSGFCSIRNEREAVIVRADNVRSIHMQLLTHGEPNDR